MQKIVITDTWDGFYLSNQQAERYRELGGDFNHSSNIARDCPLLVKVVTSFPGHGLKVVDVPDDVDWVICDYDGREWVAERHQTWS